MTDWRSIEMTRKLYRATGVSDTFDIENAPSKDGVDNKVLLEKNGLRYVKLPRGTRLWHGTHGAVPYGSINTVNEPPVLNRWKKYSPIAEGMPAFYKDTQYIDNDWVSVDYPVDEPPTIEVDFSRTGRQGRWSAADIIRVNNRTYRNCVLDYHHMTNLDGVLDAETLTKLRSDLSVGNTSTTLENTIQNRMQFANHYIIAADEKGRECIFTPLDALTYYKSYMDDDLGLEEFERQTDANMRLWKRDFNRAPTRTRILFASNYNVSCETYAQQKHGGYCICMELGRDCNFVDMSTLKNINYIVNIARHFADDLPTHYDKEKFHRQIEEFERAFTKIDEKHIKRVSKYEKDFVVAFEFCNKMTEIYQENGVEISGFAWPHMNGFHEEFMFCAPHRDLVWLYCLKNDPNTIELEWTKFT